MKELGVSSRALCKDIGINEPNFSAYLNGRRRLPYKDLEIILGYLGLVLSGGRIRDSIRFAMWEKGIGTNQLAEKCGLVTTSLSSFLTGQRGMGYEKIEKIADFLGLRLEPKKDFVFHSIFLDEKEAERQARLEEKRAQNETS